MSNLVNNCSEIKNSIEVYQNDKVQIKRKIRLIYVLLLKTMLTSSYRDLKIPLNPEDITFFGTFVDKYNLFDQKSYSEYFNGSNKINEFSKLILLLNYSKGKKRKRGIKKNSTRIYSDIRKVCIQYGIHISEPKYCESLKLGYHSYREALINIRTRLRTKLFEAIPSDLSLVLVNGKSIIVKDLYAFEELKKCYVLDKNIQMSKTDLRNLQILIMPYIFNITFSCVKF